MTMPQDLEQHLAIAEDAAVDLDTRIQAIKQARALMKESEADAALRKRFTQANIAVNWERIRRNRDDRPEAVRLLKTIKAALPDLEMLREECDDGVEDGVYRFYHESWKVYGELQNLTTLVVAKLRALAPNPAKPLDEYFEEIIAAGTGKTWKRSDNENWTQVTRPLVEAFFHAKYFLDMAVLYGKELDTPPVTMPSGWASVLTLYGIR